MAISPVLPVFGRSILLGILFGACYDGFRLFRRAFKNGKILVFFEDVLYFFFLSIGTFWLILSQNNGVLRAFLLFGELAGMLFYFFLFSKPVMAIIRLIFKILGWILHPAVKFAIWILKKCKNVDKICKKIRQRGKNYLKAVKEVVYNKANIDRGSEKAWQKRKAKRV